MKPRKPLSKFWNRSPFFYKVRNKLLFRTIRAEDLSGITYNKCNPKDKIPRIYAETNTQIIDKTSTGLGDFDKALKIATWLRNHIKGGKGLGVDSENALKYMLKGGYGVCSDFCQVFNNFCVINDIKVREWGLKKMGSHLDGHSINEVFDRKNGIWVCLDVSECIYFLDETDNTSTPLSVSELFFDTNRKVTPHSFNPSYRKDPKKINKFYFSTLYYPFVIDNYVNSRYDYVLKKFKSLPIPIIHGILILLNKSYVYKTVEIKFKSKNITKLNKTHYDKKYSSVNVQSIIRKVENLNCFLQDATRTDTSWVGLYHGNFQNNLKNKKILELGCGDCTNLAIMAALGAEVYGNDISQKSGLIIDKLNKNYKFKYPLKFIHGDFLNSSLNENEFDFVIGKAFVHHLTNEEEIKFTDLIIKYLKPTGIVRYFEPAVNSKILDELRWLVPVPGRPSKLQKEKFKQWKLNDPHPERDNSSKHYKIIGNKYFDKVNITPIGSIERFCRLIPSKYNRSLRRLSFKIENLLPKRINYILARSHLIEYKYPKK